MLIIVLPCVLIFSDNHVLLYLDLTEAKTEILKLLARVSLKRQGFAQLLVWMQKLKLCGVHGAGRWGGEFNY
jgi:hypothetical protein